MRIKTDITALGELLIDFTPAGVSQQGMRLFEQNPGGAPANLLAAAAKFGRKTAFIGKVGKDMHGDFLKETLIRAGINTDNLIQDEKYFTTLAFVSLKENGEREFAFARKPGADTNLCMKEIDPEILENTRVFHVGSLSLTDDPSRTATYEAINIARNSGAVISYDPNYRAALWSDPETAQLRMQSLIPYVDMMKISDEETSLLTPYQDPEEAILDEKIDRLYALKDHFVEGVKKLPDTRVNGRTGRDSAPQIVSVSFAGVRSEVLLHALEDKGIYVSAGSACSSNKPAVSHTLSSMHLPKELLGSTLRFSFCFVYRKK